MEEYEYTIVITNKDDHIDGKLIQYNEDDGSTKEGNFSPLYLLGDLRKLRKYGEDVFLQYKYEKAFGITIYVHNDSTHLIFKDVLIKVIENHITNKTSLSLEELEKIKHRFNLTFRCEISQSGNEYFYTCNSISEIILCVVHYLIMHEYKINKCKHCEKYFATKNLKNEYCKRKSPYKIYYRKAKSKGLNIYKRLECKKARNRIIIEQKRDKIRIETNLRNSSCYTDEELNSFLDECADYMEEIHNYPTVTNFKKYQDFLNEAPNKYYKGRPKKYIKH